MQVALLSLLLASAASALEPCVPQDFGSSSFVCTCNSTYCDNYDPIEQLPREQVLYVTTDKQQDRFRTSLLSFSPQPGGGRVRISVDSSATYQTILGWGGAFTDASGINIAKLSQPSQDALMRSYYHNTGLDYSLGRVNMGGCDFSPRPYSYADTPDDITLGTFALQEEDLVYKIPYIKQAQSLRDDQLVLFGSPWSGPPWMKSNNDFIGLGFLLPQYYQIWADYFVRFLEEYESQGVTFWGVTAQNEPEAGTAPGYEFNCMGWNASTQAKFVTQNLGPTLQSSGFEEVKVMILDSQRTLAVDWAREVFADPLANLYVHGVGIHWYADSSVDNPQALETLHQEYPDQFLLYTEACNGFGDANPNSVILGSWERGEQYIHNVLQDVNHWVVGWTDWNIALDMEGGPNWAGKAADAPIIINEETDEFYKQPMYFALGHISRFMPAGSVRIDLAEDSSSDLEFAGVERPDGGIAITILNRNAMATRQVSIFDAELGYVDIDVGPSSIHSITYWR